jgi:hypothetical protein
LADGAAIISSAGSSNGGSSGHVSEAFGEGVDRAGNGKVLANEVGGNAKVDRDGGSDSGTSAGVGSAAVASGVAAGLNASCRYSASSGEGNWGSGGGGGAVLEVSLVEELGRDCSEAEGSNNDCLEHGLFVCYF